MNKHQIKEEQSIRNTRSSSGWGGIKPEGLKPPGAKKWVSKPQYVPKPARARAWPE